MARRAPPSCPHCGADVPRGALACPECGSDAESGWSRDADVWGGDIPTGYGDDEDDGFDYEETLRNEGLLPGAPPSRAALRRRRAFFVAMLIVASLLAWLVLRGGR